MVMWRIRLPGYIGRLVVVMIFVTSALQFVAFQKYKAVLPVTPQLDEVEKRALVAKVTVSTKTTKCAAVIQGTTCHLCDDQSLRNDKCLTHSLPYPNHRVEPEKQVPQLLTRFRPLLLGKRRTSPGFLTIGIPSVRRPNINKIYLFETLDSLIRNTDDKQKATITAVIFLSDKNVTYNSDIGARLLGKYRKYCDSGFFQIIQHSIAHDLIYPNLTNVKKTFKDSKDRLRWRAKQNIDFAFLFTYSKNISKYYIQIEDDVISASHFVDDIGELIHKQTTEWFLLEYSNLGFIGKMFHSADLDWVAKYILEHYDQLPGDLLIGKMRKEKGQARVIHSKVSLFQHIGKFSSLKNKLMPSIDAKFKDAGNVTLSMNVIPKGDNPAAIINTNLTPYEEFIPLNAYDNDTNTFFWGKTPVKNDHFTLIFSKPYNISRIIISTGDPDRKKDSLPYAELHVSVMEEYELESHEENRKCAEFEKLVKFIDGEVDTKATGGKIPSNIVCLRIKVTKRSKRWIIIRNIEIYL